MATRCCWPPDSCIGRWSSRSPRPTISASAMHRAVVCVVEPHPLVEQRHLDVLDDRVLRQQVVRLEDEAEVAAADLGQLVVVHLGDVLRRRGSSRPLVGRSRQPRRFSRVDLPEPDGPIRATKSPSSNVQVQPLEDVDRHGPEVVVLDQVDDADDGGHEQSAKPGQSAPVRLTGTPHGRPSRGRGNERRDAGLYAVRAAAAGAGLPPPRSAAGQPPGTPPGAARSAGPPFMPPLPFPCRRPRPSSRRPRPAAARGRPLPAGRARPRPPGSWPRRPGCAFGLSTTSSPSASPVTDLDHLLVEHAERHLPLLRAGRGRPRTPSASARPRPRRRPPGSGPPAPARPARPRGSSPRRSCPASARPPSRRSHHRLVHLHVAATIQSCWLATAATDRTCPWRTRPGKASTRTLAGCPRLAR